MTARVLNDLVDFAFGNFIRVDTANAAAFFQAGHAALQVQQGRAHGGQGREGGSGHAGLLAAQLLAHVLQIGRASCRERV